MPPSSRNSRKSHPASSKATPQSSPRYPPQRKPNNSILNFFKKSDAPSYSSQTRISNFLVRNKRKPVDDDDNQTKGAPDEDLFFEEKVESQLDSFKSPSRDDADVITNTEIVDEHLQEDSSGAREAHKKQKLDIHEGRDDCDFDLKPAPSRRIGPFVEDSDSEEEVDTVDAGDEDVIDTNRPVPPNHKVLLSPYETTEFNGSIAQDVKTESLIGGLNDQRHGDNEISCPMCDMPLANVTELEASSHVNQCLDGQQQSHPEFPAEPEMVENPLKIEPEIPIDTPRLKSTSKRLSHALGSAHVERRSSVLLPSGHSGVNQRLDGQQQSHFECSAPPETVESPIKIEPDTTPIDTPRHQSMSKRLSHALGSAQAERRSSVLQSSRRSSSAFTELMNNDVENRAWSTAAADNSASRGKRAVERTCPFYKILPGFSICVDAFRYGAVEGCNAYFLSHFHGDHYMGLRASWKHGPIYCSKVTASLVHQQLKVDRQYLVPLEFDVPVEVPETGGVRVTMISANHCPGSSIFLFEKVIGAGQNPKVNRVLHCGDFRAHPLHVQHPQLMPETFDSVSKKRKVQLIDSVYLDTTYLNPKYAFPCQEDVISACSEVCINMNEGQSLESATHRAGPVSGFFSRNQTESRKPDSSKSGRLLVVTGTYSIGKERVCVGIAKALSSKIYANARKQAILKCLGDDELSSLLTSDPFDAQVHMHTLADMRPDTLIEYLHPLKSKFSRVAGFRPTGWVYHSPGSRLIDNPSISDVLYSSSWNTTFTVKDISIQRGSTSQSACFEIPYSEHSSFRELSMFCCALRIGRIIPTVNVGSQKSREQMRKWFDRWESEKRRNGLFKVQPGAKRW